MSLKIKCSACGKVMTAKAPTKPGSYKVKCPGCGKTLKFTAGEPDDKNKPQVGPPPMIGEFEVSTQHEARCPLCGGVTKVNLSKRDVQMIRCTACGGVLLATGLPTGTVIFGQEGLTGDMRQGIIRVHKGSLSQMFGHGPQMLLKRGSNIIGRYDPIAPSDFNLSDRAVSRRSLEIYVDCDPVGGLSFKLTVLNAANPVYHNGQLLRVGNALGLKFGDRIQVGRTILDFIPKN